MDRLTAPDAEPWYFPLTPDVCNKEFMRLGCLRTMMTLLKIPNINIVFSVIRVLKLISSKGFMEDPNFKDGNREQVMLFLSKFTFTTTVGKSIPDAENAIVKKIVKREAKKALEKAIGNVKVKECIWM
jgi:hypothetical protein